jgi:hypothetical protein
LTRRLRLRTFLLTTRTRMMRTEAEENFVLEKNPVDAVLPNLTSTYKSLTDKVPTVVKLFRHEKYMKLDGFCINNFLKNFSFLKNFNLFFLLSICLKKYK